MSPTSRGAWFWRPDRLDMLVAALRKLAKGDEKSLYFGPDSLTKAVIAQLRKDGLIVSEDQAMHGVRILIALGGLEERGRSRRWAGYRRGFWPDRLPKFTWAVIEQVREIMGR